VRTINPVQWAVGGLLVAIAVALFLFVTLMAARKLRDALPENPGGLTARTAAIDRLNGDIRRQ
jgi:hypothetical protein